jgi:PAS domain-containing protein
MRGFSGLSSKAEQAYLGQSIHWNWLCRPKRFRLATHPFDTLAFELKCSRNHPFTLKIIYTNMDNSYANFLSDEAHCTERFPMERCPMGKNLTYEDLESAFQTLKSELAGYKRKEAHAKAIFDIFMEVAKRLRSGIYRFDVQNRKFLFFNRAAIDLLGSEKAEAKEITSKSVSLRIHPKDREKVRKAARDSIVPGMTGGEAEYRYRRWRPPSANWPSRPY